MLLARLPLAALFTVLFTAALLAEESPNTLTADEQKLGFQLLFDGKSLEGWKHAGNWKVADGVIERTGKGGDLIYDVKPVPDDFELRFEWKVAEGSNSGIYYRPGQYEYQVLDNDRHPNGKVPDTTAASLYYCIAPSRDVTNEPGEWNTGRIVCQGTVIQHWLNGEKVVDINYSHPDPKLTAAIEKLKKRGATLDSRGAKLKLQDHGDPVWYRSLRMRKLSGQEELDNSPLKGN
ncbi:DUF1080 domain-containing protein [Blastopirellula marina]|uniref:DUF1080 domain-containing protein n=1 Tax=Blastopirellula marina TaxID=124 RepID=A0A2S8FN39_9BACT|nr:DUF1080 domain-containing protein [Blastopirellula marina]PQO33547.1 DUF1080 domain-containing protein [Blastopirellula marina]PTL43334.1 DUF1080 domain-containing protein [Blastopirellula marina]